jgi:hypothetical protein
MTDIITAKGTKGLLQWLKTAQPDFYAYLSPQLVAIAKQATLKGLNCMPMQGLGRMSDGYSSYVTQYASSSAPSSSIDAGVNPGFNDLVIAPQTTDAVSAASSTNTSQALANTISALANGYTAVTLTGAQVSANNTLLQTNLQRAQQGLPPLTMQTAGGVTSLTSNSGLLLVGVAVVAALMLGKGKSSV